jgi:hypothetical protein
MGGMVLLAVMAVGAAKGAWAAVLMEAGTRAGSTSEWWGQ